VARTAAKISTVVLAAQEDGKRIGRIRMRRVPDASGLSLLGFIADSIEPGSLIHTDGWESYKALPKKGYRHKISKFRGKSGLVFELLPRVHLVVSLLKRWLLGTLHGRVSPEHLDYYLDEFTFRFNRRTSASRGKLFYRLIQQAVQVPPTPYRTIITPPQIGDT
jgi:transposase-like protein